MEQFYRVCSLSASCSFILQFTNFHQITFRDKLIWYEVRKLITQNLFKNKSTRTNAYITHISQTCIKSAKYKYNGFEISPKKIQKYVFKGKVSRTKQSLEVNFKLKRLLPIPGGSDLGFFKATDVKLHEAESRHTG